MSDAIDFPLLQRDLWFAILPVVDAKRNRILPVFKEDGRIVLVLDCEFGNEKPNIGLIELLQLLWFKICHPFTRPLSPPKNHESVEKLIANLEFRFLMKFRAAGDLEYLDYRARFDDIFEYYYLEPNNSEDQASLKFANGELYDPDVQGVWGPINKKVIDQELRKRRAELN